MAQTEITERFLKTADQVDELEKRLDKLEKFDSDHGGLGK